MLFLVFSSKSQDNQNQGSERLSNLFTFAQFIDSQAELGFEFITI